jgi:hypothetical protein
VETWSVIFAGVSAAVALVSAIASGVAAWRSREAKRVAEEKRDEAVAAANKVATGDRIAQVHESRQTADESSQASSVVFVQSPVKGGRTGWRVQNDSDQPVTKVAVSSATGAKIQVYNNDLSQLTEYVEHTLGGRQQSQLMFRPTDSDGAQADPAEVERMAVRFTNARRQTWERIGSQPPQRMDS